MGEVGGGYHRPVTLGNPPLRLVGREVTFQKCAPATSPLSPSTPHKPGQVHGMGGEAPPGHQYPGLHTVPAPAVDPASQAYPGGAVQGLQVA